MSVAVLATHPEAAFPMVGLHEYRCCRSCRYWLEGYTDPRMGFCENKAVSDNPGMIEGEAYFGDAGIETAGGSRCAAYEKIKPTGQQ
jgi:hypothetical protein